MQVEDNLHNMELLLNHQDSTELQRLDPVCPSSPLVSSIRLRSGLSPISIPSAQEDASFSNQAHLADVPRPHDLSSGEMSQTHSTPKDQDVDREQCTFNFEMSTDEGTTRDLGGVSNICSNDLESINDTGLTRSDQVEESSPDKRCYSKDTAPTNLLENLEHQKDADISAISDAVFSRVADTDGENYGESFSLMSGNGLKRDSSESIWCLQESDQILYSATRSMCERSVLFQHGYHRRMTASADLESTRTMDLNCSVFGAGDLSVLKHDPAAEMDKLQSKLAEIRKDLNNIGQDMEEMKMKMANPQALHSRYTLGTVEALALTPGKEDVLSRSSSKPSRRRNSKSETRSSLAWDHSDLSVNANTSVCSQHSRGINSPGSGNSRSQLMPIYDVKNKNSVCELVGNISSGCSDDVDVIRGEDSITRNDDVDNCERNSVSQLICDVSCTEAISNDVSGTDLLALEVSLENNCGEIGSFIEDGPLGEVTGATACPKTNKQ